MGLIFRKDRNILRWVSYYRKNIFAKEIGLKDKKDRNAFMVGPNYYTKKYLCERGGNIYFRWGFYYCKRYLWMIPKYFRWGFYKCKKIFVKDLWKNILGGALLAGIFLFVYTFIDSTPHGMYGDDEAKKVQRLVMKLDIYQDYFNGYVATFCGIKLDSISNETNLNRIKINVDIFCFYSWSCTIWKQNWNI